jgi:hypothetical protein
VDSLEQAVAAVGEVSGYDRRHIRQRFEQRFSARGMALNYDALYRCLHSLGNIEPRRQA